MFGLQAGPDVPSQVSEMPQAPPALQSCSTLATPNGRQQELQIGEEFRENPSLITNNPLAKARGWTASFPWDLHFEAVLAIWGRVIFSPSLWPSMSYWAEGRAGAGTRLVETWLLLSFLRGDDGETGQPCATPVTEPSFSKRDLPVFPQVLLEKEPCSDIHTVCSSPSLASPEASQTPLPSSSLTANDSPGGLLGPHVALLKIRNYVPGAVSLQFSPRLLPAECLEPTQGPSQMD